MNNNSIPFNQNNSGQKKPPAKQEPSVRKNSALDRSTSSTNRTNRPKSKSQIKNKSP